jgi:DNA modification methylase
MTLHTGDCLDVMAEMPAASVDAIVTDPPYDLLSASRNGSRRINNPDNPAGRTGRGFMGKTWDGTGIGFDPETWALALRVAKPGAYLLAFGGTRTYHRLACAIEDAGWIIRDCLVWAYAQGFPKSRALLKPAWEPIVMARKPGPLRELAIDACRIPVSPDDPVNVAEYVHPGVNRSAALGRESREAGRLPMRPELGRWPANVILTDPIFDGDVDGVVGGGAVDSSVRVSEDRDEPGVTYALGRTGVTPRGHTDTGTYSRFFSLPVTMGTCQYCGVPSAELSSPASGTTDTPSGTAPEPASSLPSSPPSDRAPSAAVPSGDPGASSARPSAELWADAGDESSRADQSTSGTESGSSRRPEPTTPPTLRSKPPAISPRNTSRSDPATSADQPATASATTTTTPSRWMCESCAALVTAESTPAGTFDGLRDSPEVPAGQPNYPRFFLIPKADRAEREPVFGGLERVKAGALSGAETRPDHPFRRNHHPTVKPLDLMRHLVRLVTPPSGTVLDPFLGSGTTAIAAEMEGFAWIGIEREAEYVAIAEARLRGVQRGLGLSA